MVNNIVFLGLDVDDKAFHGAAVNSDGVLIGELTCKPTRGALTARLKQLQEKSGKSLKICYEATYLGFSLCRDLRAEGFDCEVIAPSLIPEVSGKKVKTDKIDARKLAHYYACGLLTIVRVPSLEDEAERDLIRSRTFTVRQFRSVKQHILSVCRRMNLNFKHDTENKNHWTKVHVQWLHAQVNRLESPSLKRNLQILLQHYEQLEGLIDSYNFEIQELARSDKYLKKTQALTVYRGINITTAMVFITEIGDITRFDHPRRLTSYFGMDVTEYSSGGKQRQYRITKMGNTYGRCAVIETCQKVFSPPRVCYDLKKRRENVDKSLTAIADRCMERLYKKSNRMLHAGKNRNVTKVACAREMFGFIWESLRAVA
jgi:transposase